MFVNDGIYVEVSVLYRAMHNGLGWHHIFEKMQISCLSTAVDVGGEQGEYGFFACSPGEALLEKVLNSTLV